MTYENLQIPDVNFQMLLAQAKDALVEKNFEDAEAKFKAALELGRQLHSEPCQDTTACLVGLGDVYFGAGMFEPAKDFYKKALQEHDATDKAERKNKVSPLFRYCKTLVVLKEYGEADRNFADAVELAELLLPLGNPLLTGIYDAYANMIADSGIDAGRPERENYFREKAENSRRKFVAPMRPKPTATQTNLPKLREAERPGATVFERMRSPNAMQSATIWMARNYQVFLILLLVAAGAFAYSDHTVRSALLHLIQK